MKIVIYSLSTPMFMLFLGLTFFGSLAEGYFKMHSLRVCDANFLAKMADGVY